MKRAFRSASLASRQPPWWERLVALICMGLTLAASVRSVAAQDERRSSAEAGHDPNAEADPPPPAALAHYEKGRTLYLAGRYREAVVELERALALDPDSPNLVYNLARVYELLGEIDLAIRHYKHYRELLPSSETTEIARVDGTLQRLEGAREEVVDAPTPAPPPPPPERGVADGAFWTLTVAALGAFVAGGVVGYTALEAERETKRFVLGEDGDIDDRKQKEDRTNRLALASDMSLLAGAVLGTTAILLFALRTKPPKSPPKATLGIDASTRGGFLMLKGRL